MEPLSEYIRQEWHRVSVHPPDEKVARDLALQLSYCDVWTRGTSPEGLSVRTDNLVPAHYSEMLTIIEAARTSTQGILFHSDADRT